MTNNALLACALIVRCKECIYASKEIYLDSDFRVCSFWDKIMECDGFCHKGVKVNVKEKENE